MAPPVSVVICLFNSMRYIDETLQSLLAQTWSDFEAVLVDDGSNDGTADYIEKHYPDPRLKLIRQVNRGMGMARAKCVEHSIGGYVAFLDHDDIWFPHKLERQMMEASRRPEASVIFADCLLVQSNGDSLTLLSEEYNYHEIDLRAGYAHDELLRRGCFIGMSTAMVKLADLKKFDKPNRNLRYGDDYDMWLQLSRNCPLHYIDEPLAKWRIHQASITQKHPEISIRSHTYLWKPVIHNRTYPPSLRTLVADHLFGQQRLALRHLARAHRFNPLLKMVAEVLSEPEPLVRYVKDRLYRTSLGKFLITLSVRSLRFIATRMARLKKSVFSHQKKAKFTEGRDTRGMDVWIDGTCLATNWAGYRNFVCETVRALLADRRGFVVHVTTDAQGKIVLRSVLGEDCAGVRFHRSGRPFQHRSTSLKIPPHQIVLRFFRALFPNPPDLPPETRAAEIVIWRGRFRNRKSRKISVVHDITTRLLPELHTAANVAEFERFAGYAKENADLIATVSEQSRRDIVDYLDVRPNSVRVVLSNINPIFFHPGFDRSIPVNHGLNHNYILFVGAIEPRKNLRRLIEAFSLLQVQGVLSEHVLAIAGPQGWDDSFHSSVTASEAASNIRMLGYVRAEDLPSLYHFASTFVYPSVYEGFGLPVLEALCSSASVITSNVSSLSELAGGVVKTFDPLDTLDIAEAILYSCSMTHESSFAYRKQCRARGLQLLRESAERQSMATLLANELEDQCALPSYSPSLT